MIKKIIVKYGYEWVLLVVVILLYLITLFFNQNIFFNSLLYAKRVFIEVLPILIVMFILIFFSNLWLSSNKIKKILTKKPGFWQYFSSVVLGILSTGPIYMWYPLLAELKEKGLKNSLITIFLYNRAVKIALIPMIIYYFGVPFLLITTFLMILFSLLNGLVVQKLIKN